MNQDRSSAGVGTSDFRTYVESNEHLRRVIKVDQNDSTGILEALVDFKVISTTEKDALEEKLAPNKICGSLIIRLAEQEHRLKDIISAFCSVNALEVANLFRQWQQKHVQSRAATQVPSSNRSGLRRSNLSGDNLIPEPVYQPPNSSTSLTTITWSQPFPDVQRIEDRESTYRIQESIQQIQCYEAGKQKRRYALVINNLDFPKLQDHKEKSRGNRGAKEDAMRVNEVLTRSGFTLFYIENCLKQDLQDKGGKLDEFIELVQDHGATAVAVFLMSHGAEKNMMQMHDSTEHIDTWLNYDKEVIEKFCNHSCPGLVGVPKMFFLQLCRGNFFDEGLTTDSEVEIRSRECNWNPFPNNNASKGSKQHEPTYSDMIIAYACYEGFTSWKESRTGSWFIQTLCEFIALDKEQNVHLDISELLAKVNEVIRDKAVKEEYKICKTGEIETSYWKQVCPFSNIAFSKKFFFNSTSLT